MAKLKAKIGSGEVGRFDQRNTMYMRPRDAERSDARILDIGKRHYSVKRFGKAPGYTMRDWAFSMAMWYMERWWGFGNMVGNEGLLHGLRTRQNGHCGTAWNREGNGKSPTLRR